MLGDCLYCDDRLTSELKSVSCDNCGEGYHTACAEKQEGFDIDKKGGLLRSTTFKLTCPDCGETWRIDFDPRD